MGNALMRTFFVCLVGLVLFFGCYRWWSGRNNAVTNIAATTTTSALGGEDVALPAARKELFSAPRAAIQPANALKLSEACSKLWNDLRTLNLSQADRRLPSPSGCDKLPPNLTSWHETYSKACAKPKSTECEIAIYDYRAALTEELTKDIPLNQISDPKVLTDKMLARLRAGQMIPGNVADVADRLLETEPNSPQIGRAALTMRIQSAEEAMGKPDDPRWKQVDEALEKAKRTGEGDSRTLLEAKLISDHLRYPNPEHTAQAADEITRQYPKLGVGPYHQAWVEFDRGNKQREHDLCRSDEEQRGARDELHSR